MPLLVAQDHCWGGGDTDSRGLLKGLNINLQREPHTTEIHLTLLSWVSQAATSLQLLDFLLHFSPILLWDSSTLS